jgi:hypothetical protein
MLCIFSQDGDIASEVNSHLQLVDDILNAIRALVVSHFTDVHQIRYMQYLIYAFVRMA